MSSSTDTLESNTRPEAAETPEGHQGHDHDHDHAHEHAHGPVLNPDCTRELVIDVPAEEVGKTFRRVARGYQKYARFPGFRPGKAPDSVVRRKFASEIRKEVIDTLLPERFNQGVQELGIRPVGQPQVTELTVEDGQPLHVKAVFESIPSISIEGYETVTVEKPPVEVTDEEFRRELEELRESRATIEPVEEDRALADGDWAQIAYSGAIADEDQAAPVASEDTLVEVGGKNTMDAFNTVLRGAKPGQELKAEVVYPADYPEARLAGKTVAYEVTVKAIKKRIVPELNDDFAKELGNYESLADLETRVREHMANRKRRSVEAETKDKLFAALTEKFQFPVPETLVQDQVDHRLERGLRALAAQGMEAEQMRKLDFTRLRGAQRDGAMAEVKAFLLMDRIAEVEGITVSDEEVDREVQLAALQSGESPEALRERLTKDGGLARIREQMKREKTANLLYERLPA
ncbi:MAG TPA: trigger factor [Terracidiphilus sp.]|nr:trigger factor [Terracidiphilus sp.]